MTKTRFPRTWFGFRPRTLIVLLVVALIGGAALGLDLMSEGLIYDQLWQLTGETEPDQPLLGFGQYLARYTRRQPDTEPYADIQYADVNPYGINTFLEQEVEPQKRELQVQMIAEAGFHWLRQQFPWEDIEHHAKGDFMDRRNDLDGDGVTDEISAWIKYDNIVDLTEQYGLELIVRLSAPPEWAHPGQIATAPPDNFQDFVDYAAAVATHYQGRIHYWQVWNEPNLFPEWGNQTVNAEAYAALLCQTYHKLKEIDPENVVITGALGPTIDLSGVNAYDLLYLQRMYQAGAGDCFDILSVQGYGLWSGPTDQRLRQVTINYQRHLWIRDMMVANGDADKAIWISEAGWNPVPEDPTINDATRYGRVTADQAANWAPLAYERAIEEWPWIGVVNYWYFKRATWDERDRGQAWFYFRLINPDFTPTPTYETLKTYITGEQPKTLGAGRHGFQNRGLITANADGSETRTFRINGTGLYFCGEDSDVSYTIDDDGAHTLHIASGCTLADDQLEAGEHLVTITAHDWTGLHSMAVLDWSARQRLPWILTGLAAALVVLVVFGQAILKRL